MGKWSKPRVLKGKHIDGQWMNEKSSTSLIIRDTQMTRIWWEEPWLLLVGKLISPTLGDQWVGSSQMQEENNQVTQPEQS